MPWSKSLKTFGIQTNLYYGVKVNKSQSLLQAAVAAGTGADVSSLYELNDAIRAGCRVQSCVLQALQNNGIFTGVNSARARIVIDSLEEMDELIHLATGG